MIARISLGLFLLLSACTLLGFFAVGGLALGIFALVAGIATLAGI